MTELHNPIALDFSILIDLLVSPNIHMSLYIKNISFGGAIS
jgi:hypothetical protein